MTSLIRVFDADTIFQPFMHFLKLGVFACSVITGVDFPKLTCRTVSRKYLEINM